MNGTDERMESSESWRRSNRLSRAIPLLLAVAALVWPSPVHAAVSRPVSDEQLQQALRRFPDADLNKDGRLTLEEFRQYRLSSQTGGGKGTALRSTGGGRKAAAAEALAGSGGRTPAATAAAAGPVELQINSENPIAVNPLVYGTWCEEMFSKDLVDEPEYIAALEDLKFKSFLYPGGSISYYHHPTGTGGFNIRPEEVAKSKHGENSRFMKEGLGPDHLEQYIQFVKASGGSSLFVANILNGTVEELDEFLGRLKAAQVPIACVILGVEMHLGQPGQLGQDWHVDHIKTYFPMLQSKYPDVPIVLHSTPVGRVGDRGSDYFHEWNRRLVQFPDVAGFSQYGWPEFGGQARLNSASAAGAKTPSEIFAQYDEFTREFPTVQIPAYQKDWGVNKKMYILQWGTHSDRNTCAQGLHIANFYFFLAQYNAAHDNYIAAATSSVNLAQPSSKNRPGQEGIVYKEKIALLAPYFYTKPFRHLFSGDMVLLGSTVQGAEGRGRGEAVKALAATGPDGRKYLYLLNSGTAISLGAVAVDGKTLPADTRVEVESVGANPAAIGQGPRGEEPPEKVFVGERSLGGVVLEPLSLTLLMIPQ